MFVFLTSCSGLCGLQTGSVQGSGDGQDGAGSDTGAQKKAGGKGGAQSETGSKEKAEGKGGAGSDTGSKEKAEGKVGAGSDTGSKEKAEGKCGLWLETGSKEKMEGNGGVGSETESMGKSDQRTVGKIDAKEVKPDPAERRNKEVKDAATETEADRVIDELKDMVTKLTEQLDR